MVFVKEKGLEVLIPVLLSFNLIERGYTLGPSKKEDSQKKLLFFFFFVALFGFWLNQRSTINVINLFILVSSTEMYRISEIV